MIRLGYACTNTLLPTPSRTTRLANATPERILEIARGNLDALEAILRWNVAQGIEVFRLSSDLIPLASHPDAQAPWRERLAGRLAELGALMRAHQMRLSMHPGQYTLLGSPDPRVTDAAFADLIYHDALLDAFGLDRSHKLVIHLGGVYGDPAGTAVRVCERHAALPERVRRRLVFENDERWALDAVLDVARRVGAPVVFDAFHHALRPSGRPLSDREGALLAAATWGPADGPPEVHFSVQAAGRRPGAHADEVAFQDFEPFAQQVADLDLDCILEVKDKEQSVLRVRDGLVAAGQAVIMATPSAMSTTDGTMSTTPSRAHQRTSS